MKARRFLATVLLVLVGSGAAVAQEVCPPDIVWAEVVGSAAVVHHEVAEFNCYPTMEYQIAQDGFTIDIYEIEVEAGAWCICCFDLSHTLTGLDTGDYTVRVWGAYGCESTPCGTTTFTVPAPPAAAASKTGPLNMESSMSDCGGWPLFADGFESGSTEAWSETVYSRHSHLTRGAATDPRLIGDRYPAPWLCSATSAARRKSSSSR